MPLDVVRLRDSDLSVHATGDEFRCAVLLWCASWHQVPAASIPNDDVVLAQLAGFGRVVKEWKKIREGSLRGWIICSDGRIYHPVVAEKANEAWAGRLVYRAKKEAERLRKAAEREAKRIADEAMKSAGHGRGQTDLSAGQSSVVLRTNGNCPPENALKETVDSGEGEGQLNQQHSVPNGTDAEASDSGLTAEEAIFKIVVPWLVERGVPDKSARSLMGAARKQLKDDGAWELAQRLMTEKPVEPAAWLAASINARVKTSTKKVDKHGGFDKQDYRSGVADDGSF